MTGIARVVSCPQVGLPCTCLFQHPLLWGLMLFVSLLMLCSTSDPLGSLVFCLFALGGCLVFLCFVRILDTSFCREGVSVHVLFVLVLLVVVVLELLLLSLLLVAPLDHLWWTRLCMLCSPQSLLSLTTLCLVLLSSLLSSHHRFCILCCHLLASPLFVSMLSSCHVWSIICLLWNVHVPSWLDMYTFPIWTFFDPIVLCWTDFLWMWNCWLVWLCRGHCLTCWSHLSERLLHIVSILWCLWLIGRGLLRRCLCWPSGWWKCWLWWYVAWKGCSPFHFEPCFSCPVVSLYDPLLLLLVEVLVCFFNDLCVVVWSLYDCSSVVLQPFCWNWTSAVWHEQCLALCSVDSYQEALTVECAQIVLVAKDLHACRCQCDWWYFCCCSFCCLVDFKPQVGWQCYQHNWQEVKAFSLLECWVESLGVCDRWCFVELCVEPLFCQSCYWHNGLCHITHIEGNNQCLLVGVVHVHPFVAVYLDVFICCCP